ncbi:hypothetical protein CCS92_33655, partial [Methylobacterium radiotolerans]
AWGGGGGGGGWWGAGGGGCVGVCVPSVPTRGSAARARDYERPGRAEGIALGGEIGGGTSDFSTVRLAPGRRGRPAR